MIDEKTLTLHYYADGLDEAERRDVDRALASDPVLAARYESIRNRLDALRSDDHEDPAPGHLKHQWHDLVAREARLERQSEAPRRTHRPWAMLGAAFAAVLALGIAIGLFLPGNGTVTDLESVAGPETDRAETGAPGSAAFERGLQLYLEESRGELAGLEDRRGAEQTELLMRIIAQNRLFEQAAESQQAPEIARLMRAIEPVLLRLAAVDSGSADADALRRQLAFELNAMLTKLQQDPSKKATTT